jgi:hypothetical protein
VSTRDALKACRWALRHLEARAFAPGAPFDPVLNHEIDRLIVGLDALRDL